MNLNKVALAIIFAVLTAAQTVSASDTLTDAITLQESGASDDVIVAWAARQPPVPPTKQAMEVLLHTNLSSRVIQALVVGNSRPGFVPQQPAPVAAPVQAVVPVQDQPDEIEIQPAVGAVGSDVFVTGYDPWVAYYGWPYYGNVWGYWGNDRWNHNYWHNGWNNGWSNGHGLRSGYHSGVGQFNGIRNERPATVAQNHSVATQGQSQVVVRQTYSSGQSYSSGVASRSNAGSYSSHSYSGGSYSGGRSYSGGGYSGGHSFGGGHGGGRR
jgi:hypothetical protein